MVHIILFLESRNVSQISEKGYKAHGNALYKGKKVKCKQFEMNKCLIIIIQFSKISF